MRGSHINVGYIARCYVDSMKLELIIQATEMVALKMGYEISVHLCVRWCVSR